VKRRIILDKTKLSQRFRNFANNIGSKRDVLHLYNNMWDGKLHLDYFINGIEHNKTVGETDGHGRWFTWEL